MLSKSKRQYGVGKPHIFKTKLGWCSIHIRNGIHSNWFGTDFWTICYLNSAGVDSVATTKSSPAPLPTTGGHGSRKVGS